MNAQIFTETYGSIPVCEKEILRYAGCPAANDETLSLLEECLKEGKETFTYKVCFRELCIKTEGNTCHFDLFSLRSESLVRNLAKSKKVLVFAATVGIGIDRLITKYSRISPSKALLFQAMGAERIEALCDTFCTRIAKEYGLSPASRFSPGYGDLPLPCQKNIFAVLDCERKIGLTLNSSLLMSPTKSVTAFLGLEEKI